MENQNLPQNAPVAPQPNAPPQQILDPGGQIEQNPINNNKSSRLRLSKKKLIGLTMLAILLIGGAVYYLRLNNKNSISITTGENTTQKEQPNSQPSAYLPKNYTGGFELMAVTFYEDKSWSPAHYTLTFTYPSSYDSDRKVILHSNLYRNDSSVFNPPSDCGNGAEVTYLKDNKQAIPCELYTKTSRGREVYAYMYLEVGNKETRVYYVKIDDYVLYIPVFFPQVSKDVISQFVDSFEQATPAEIEKSTR